MFAMTGTSSDCGAAVRQLRGRGHGQISLSCCHRCHVGGCISPGESFGFANHVPTCYVVLLSMNLDGGLLHIFEHSVLEVAGRIVSLCQRKG